MTYFDVKNITRIKKKKEKLGKIPKLQIFAEIGPTTFAKIRKRSKRIVIGWKGL